jgi:transcriptional regulator
VYIPNQYRMEDRGELVAFMRANPFALVVSGTGGAPLATHLPLTIAEEGERVLIRGHFARANPQWRALDDGQTLVVFSGPHTYVSPAHYDRRESVPTWNYLAVHARGQARTVSCETDRGQLESLLEELIGANEPAYLEQWRDLGERYREGMLRGIVGFELAVESLEGKAKLSQNKSLDEQRRIARALADGERPEERALGEEMARRLTRGE